MARKKHVHQFTDEPFELGDLVFKFSDLVLQAIDMRHRWSWTLVCPVVVTVVVGTAVDAGTYFIGFVIGCLGLTLMTIF